MADDASLPTQPQAPQPGEQAPQHVLTDEEYARLQDFYQRLPRIEAELAEAQRQWDAEEAAERAAAAEAAVTNQGD